MSTASQKPLHTIVLDTGAIIKNEPSVSTLLAKADSLVTVPAIISEIRDATTRSRVETTLRPFLTLRSPNPNSIKFVTDFARRTGDLGVLSKPDIHIIALTYEIECERNGGDWRLRRLPGQKTLNGAPPSKPVAVKTEASEDRTETTPDTQQEFSTSAQHKEPAEGQSESPTGTETNVDPREPSAPSEEATSLDVNKLSDNVTQLKVDDVTESISKVAKSPVDSAQNSDSNEDSGSESEGWITPSNLKKRQAHDAGASSVQAQEPNIMQVGVLTTDFAMQNVILQMNLNLLSPSVDRVRHLKTFVLRCHACFHVTKDMSKQFCPKCGQPTLTRVSCSTNANGEFKLHLKKNMQWNTRGDRYSIPKPAHGSANGKIKGGGKGGWGNGLILTEDQKEYERANKAEKMHKERNLMDEDYLPSILTGDRGQAGGRIRVGAGRNVNSRKR